MKQNDKTKMSAVVEIFININEEISIIEELTSDLTEQFNLSKNIYNQVITPYHLLANKLDPRYFVRRLSNAEDENVLNYKRKIFIHYSYFNECKCKKWCI